MQGKESEATVLMHAHGWTRPQLARVLGCGETHVWKYLNGHRRVSAVQASKLESATLCTVRPGARCTSDTVRASIFR